MCGKYAPENIQNKCVHMFLYYTWIKSNTGPKLNAK